MAVRARGVSADPPTVGVCDDVGENRNISRYPPWDCVFKTSIAFAEFSLHVGSKISTCPAY
eukprot:6111601-Prymnesium_polylepis.1